MRILKRAYEKENKSNTNCTFDNRSVRAYALVGFKAYQIINASLNQDVSEDTKDETKDKKRWMVKMISHPL